ncbi:MbeD/MobD family mobilization/exclusion protein [Pseudomonas sp. JV414]|uniref:MbeD/MobD family mobilization/exclusion protein n=1 Tax=Pseudomonas sp. JV414 TaxID=1733110 RepID=UPI0028F4269D|nr:MbeD/MobD family mobilization/exclusion protein [Pseudomonas sp. JV414]
MPHSPAAHLLTQSAQIPTQAHLPDMQSQTASQSNNPTWLTVGLCSLLLSVLTSAVTFAANFGEQKSDLSALKAKNEELNKGQDLLVKQLEEWRNAYKAQQTILQAKQERLAVLENDRCNPLLDQVSDLKDSINRPARYGYTEQTVANLQEVLKGYQESLQACYSARS